MTLLRQSEREVRWTDGMQSSESPPCGSFSLKKKVRSDSSPNKEYICTCQRPADASYYAANMLCGRTGRCHVIYIAINLFVSGEIVILEEIHIL